MTKKYYSMLLGGTLTIMVTSIMLMSDSIIAGAVIGPDAVASVTLVTPLYSLAGFFGSVISIGIPVLYSTEMTVLNVILRNDALVDNPLLIEEVRSDCFLQKRVTNVFFIPQYSGFDTMCP